MCNGCASFSIAKPSKVVREQRLAHGRGLQCILGTTPSTGTHVGLKFSPYCNSKVATSFGAALKDWVRNYNDGKYL